MKLHIYIRLLLIVAVIAIASFGCRSVKSSSSVKEFTTTSDSLNVHINKVIKDSATVTLPTSNTVVIPSPCDSNGNLTPVYFAFNSGLNAGSIDTRNGSIKINTKSAGATSRHTYERNDSGAVHHTNKSSVNEIVRTKHVVTTYIPIWLIIWAVAASVLAIVGWYSFFKMLFI